MNFSDLGLSDPLLRAVADKGYTQPSPIQAEAIPAILEHCDVMAAAQTGTGKTAGFTLPLLQLLAAGKSAQPLQARCLILTPTRELAAQVADSVATYGKHLSLKSAVVFGGVGIHPQIAQLKRGVDVLIATPGRLLDLYGQKAVRFDDLQILVLDEADRMLDMGFIHDIRKILALLPKQRQNLMFSATFSREIRQLAKGLVHDPVEISVSPENSTVETVRHWIHPVDKGRKPALLLDLIVDNDWSQVLVFSRTKHGANKLAKYLVNGGIDAAAIHGNKSQSARTKALADFKNGGVRVLVATDIAARGLDISQLPHVVNFDLPNVPEDYVHRIGRTGRAGASGEAISLVCADEIKQLQDIEKLIGAPLERIELEKYRPGEPLPEGRTGKAQQPRQRQRQQPSRAATAKPAGDAGAPRKRRRRPRRGSSGSNRAGTQPGGNSR